MQYFIVVAPTLTTGILVYMNSPATEKQMVAEATGRARGS